jgi:hypothetical protein
MARGMGNSSNRLPPEAAGYPDGRRQRDQTPARCRKSNGPAFMNNKEY